MRRSLEWIAVAALVGGCAGDGPLASATNGKATNADLIEAAATLPAANFNVTAPECTATGATTPDFNCPIDPTVIHFRIQVLNSATGEPVKRGTVIFMACYNVDGPAPSTACTNLDGHWSKIRVKVDPATGTAQEALRVSSGSTFGWTWEYLAQGSGVKSATMPDYIDFYGVPVP